MKILGINGSPRKANTNLMLETALKAAQAEYDIETEIIELRNKNIEPCKGCFRCSDQNNEQKACPAIDDDMETIIEKMMEADGIILASPVFFGGITGQLKIFLDRTEPLLRYSKNRFKNGLRNKVGGAIAVAGNRNGGIEASIQGMHHFFFIQDMIVVGAGPGEQPGCYLGGAGFSGADPEKGSRVLNAVASDELGIYSAELIGKRVAETCYMVKGND